MKVLLINGSPHAQGCTFTALSVVADELQRNGVETEIIHVGHKDIRGCIGCYKCRELGRCIFDKDMVNKVAKKFEQADGLIIGSPVYYAGPNGTLISFLNRLFFSASFEKRFKVGAAVVSARRMGTTATLDTLNKYFLHGEMPVAASRYWNAVHGNSPEEVMSVSVAACQSRNPSVSQRTLSNKKMTDKDMIEALYREMYKAMVEKDTATLNRVHADNFVLTHMTGMHQSKQEYIKAIAGGTLNYYSAEHEQMDIKVDGNHATLTGRSRVNAAVFGGGRHTWRLQLYFQLSKRDGHWLFTNAKASTY